MAHSLHADYTNALATGMKENWLVQLYYEDAPATASNNFLGLSFQDVTITKNAAGGAEDWDFHGAIVNAPTISETLNLERSSVSTSTMRIQLANFTYSSNPVSEELFGGSNKYINRPVKVWSVLGSSVRLDRCFNIYTGRLQQISHDDQGVSLEIISFRPWADIKIPNVASPKTNYFPVVYGNFTKESSTDSSPTFIGDGVMWPTIVESATAGKITTLVHQSLDNSSGKETSLHYFEKNATSEGNELFASLNSIPSASVTLGDGNALKTNIDLKREFKARPNSVIDEEERDKFGNYANMIDGDTSVYATYTEESASGGGSLSASVETVATHQVHFELPSYDHELSSMTVTYKLQLVSVTTSMAGGADAMTWSIVINDKTGEIDDDTAITYSGSDAAFSDTTATFYTVTKSAADQVPDKIEMEVVSTITNTTNPNAGTVSLTNFELRIYDVAYAPKLIIPISTTAATDKGIAANQAIRDIERLYCAADGFTQGWSGGNSSTLVQEPQDIIRDLLDRYAGQDDTDSTSFDAMTTNRDGWNMRLWSLEPTDLKSVLDKVAYEGACPWHFRADGKLRYITIANSPSANHTLDKNDFDNLTISHTPVRSLKTSYQVFSETHPAERRYLTASAEINNATPRTNYFAGSSFENKKKVNLDYLVANIGAAFGGDKNDDWVDWYGSFFGDVKMMISMNVVNPVYYVMEIGDIVAFTNSAMPVKAFASAWTNLKFVVTNIKRSVGRLSIQLYEV
jgi:hypothetical protein